MDKNYLMKIKRFYNAQKRMPSYGEILKITGLRSKNSAYKLVEKLVKEKILQKDAVGKIIPGKLLDELRILGTVEAGFPSPAEEETLDTITMDEYLIKNKEATYMLSVSGNSMVDAGIMKGDLVLVERGREAKPGDIVIAEVDGKWTIKYLRQRAGKFYLEAANPKYPLIFPDSDMKIEAVVVAVVRKYK